MQIRLHHLCVLVGLFALVVPAASSASGPATDLRVGTDVPDEVTSGDRAAVRATVTAPTYPD